MCKTHVLGGSKRLLLKHIHASFNMVDYLESNLKTDTILWWALEKGTCFFLHMTDYFRVCLKTMWPPPWKSKAFLLKPTPQKGAVLLGLVSCHIFLRYPYTLRFLTFKKKTPPRFVSITLAQRTQGQHQQGTRYLRQSDPKPLADISHWNPGWLVGVLIMAYYNPHKTVE